MPREPLGSYWEAAPERAALRIMELEEQVEELLAVLRYIALHSLDNIARDRARDVILRITGKDE